MLEGLGFGTISGPAVGSMDFYLLVIALALQLQTILGEQLASDDQAADVVDIGTGPCIRQSRARDIGVGRTWKT